MLQTSRTPLPRFAVRALGALAAIASLQAAAKLEIYEPFDYAAPSLISGTLATGLNLTGSYVGDSANVLFQLRVSSPGLTYGSLVGAPSTAGGKLTQLEGSGPSTATVALAAPLTILPGQTIFFSALFRFDDSANGTHRADVSLVDDLTGDTLSFGEPVAGIRTLRASVTTAATVLPAATSSPDSTFSNGQTLLLVGRYTNSPVAADDRLELLGYDTAAAHVLPAAFDPDDPQKLFYSRLDGIDMDFTRVSSLAFTIRGDDNNFIDEVRVGRTFADVTLVPEPGSWVLLLSGLTGIGCAARARFRAPASLPPDASADVSS